MGSSYLASPIKRHRRTKAAIGELKATIYDILRAGQPMTVRQVFYQLTVEHAIEKTEAEYNGSVVRLLTQMRREGMVPYSWISDNTRWIRKPTTYSGIEHALNSTAHFCRRNLWIEAPVYVEVWCESDSIAGVLIEETDRYNVPLMVSRGFSSDTYLYNAAQDIETQYRPAYLYFVGDWDPSGKIIPEKIEAGLRQHAPGCEITFQRLLVTPDQIAEWHLPTKPVKKTTHAKGFTGGTVESEAIPAATTRRIVRESIEQHLDMSEVAVMREAEQSEAALLHNIAEQIEAKQL